MKLCKIILFLPIILFMATEDFHVSHILHVSSKELNFRMGKYNQFARFWYQRADLKSPSEYVNTMYRDGDVIVVGVITSAYYLDKPFINYVTYKSNIFYNVSRDGGKTEKWTGRPLIYNINAFFDLVPINPNKSLWLIAVKKDFYGSSFEYSDSLADISEQHHMVAILRYVGVDGRIGVWEVKRLAGLKSS